MATSIVERYELIRSPEKPIITPDSGDPEANWKTYNPAFLRLQTSGGLIVYEGVVRCMDFESHKSTFEYYKGSGGVNLKKGHPQSVLKPGEKNEYMDKEGVEDGHLVLDPKNRDLGYEDRRMLLTYTAFDGKCARVALAESADFINWQKTGPVLKDWDKGFWSMEKGRSEPNWSKAAQILPLVVDGQYWMMFGDYEIYAARSNNLLDWTIEDNPVFRRRENMWDGGYVEMGGAIRTKDGILAFYHGIHRKDDKPEDPKIYRIGAVLINEKDPRKILGRTREWLLEPKKPYEFSYIVDAVDGSFEELKKREMRKSAEDLETKGKVQAVFSPSAADLGNGWLRIWYGAGDRVVCTAIGKISRILRAMEET